MRQNLDVYSLTMPTAGITRRRLERIAAPMTRNAFLTGLAGFTASVLLQIPARAATGIPSVAKTRAALYQTEARKIFEGYGWVIAHERPGEFTAVHGGYPVAPEARLSSVAAYGPQAGTHLPPMLAHVTVTFRPINDTNTQCSLRLVGYYTNTNLKSGKPSVTGPFPANSKENTKYVENLIAKAEKRLVHEHPEYTPGGPEH